MLLPAVRFSQATTCTREGRAHRAYGKSRLLSYLGVTLSRVPEEQDFTISFAERVERVPDLAHALTLRQVTRRVRRGFLSIFSLTLQEGEVAFPPDRRPGLVTGEVGRDLEEPRARLLRLMAERPDERVAV